VNRFSSLSYLLRKPRVIVLIIATADQNPSPSI
jgi:hypothetical protein